MSKQARQTTSQKISQANARKTSALTRDIHWMHGMVQAARLANRDGNHSAARLALAGIKEVSKISGLSK